MMDDESLTIDDLTIAIRRSASRKTVGITIDRDGDLFVSVPAECPPGRIEQAVQLKRFWIYQKLAAKALLAWPPREHEYTPGEGFAYLGRSYRLKLIDTSDDPGAASRPLRLLGGRFLLSRDARPHAGTHFTEWYVAHAHPWLGQCVRQWAERIDAQPEGITVRDLGYRWASCGHSRTLHFNWRAIQLPPRIVEYVVAHELVHLLELRHDSAFWQRLGRAMPDYAQRKQWLAEQGGQY
jgi:predicted metal-dependent hydrolase